MRLLFDHNLPPGRIARLRDLFPHSEHVFVVGLDRANDLEIREYAGREGFVIVTKDADFSDLCVLKGFPPKIVWIRRGIARRATLNSFYANTTTTSKPWKQIQ